MWRMRKWGYDTNGKECGAYESGGDGKNDKECDGKESGGTTLTVMKVAVAKEMAWRRGH